MRILDDSASGASAEEKAPLLSPTTEKEDDQNETENDMEKDDKPNLNIRTVNIGVWRIFYQETPWSFLPGAESIIK
jgi:hypothetical protein